MTVERRFLQKHSSLCKIDDDGIWHSLLVVLQGSKVGILVMADQEGFPIYAARFWRKIYSPLLEQHSSSLSTCQ
jgi:hypothetical protein